jgi:hypothetical protein
MNKGCPISAHDLLLVARRREALKQLVYRGLGRAIPFRYSVLRRELAAGCQAAFFDAPAVVQYEPGWTLRSYWRRFQIIINALFVSWLIPCCFVEGR